MDGSVSVAVNDDVDLLLNNILSSGTESILGDDTALTSFLDVEADLSEAEVAEESGTGLIGGLNVENALGTLLGGDSLLGELGDQSDSEV